jgi:hypothetical protein
MPAWGGNPQPIAVSLSPDEGGRMRILLNVTIGILLMATWCVAQGTYIYRSGIIRNPPGRYEISGDSLDFTKTVMFVMLVSVG